MSDIMSDIATRGEEQPGGNNTAPKRRRWGIVVRRTLLVALILLCLAVAAVVAWLGPIVERYVERNDMELVGREVEMEALSIKLFSGSVEVDNLVLYEEDAAEEFVHIDNIKATIELGDIFDKHIHITSLELRNPRVGIIQRGAIFNFDTLVAYILEEYLNDELDGDTESVPWRVTIENVAIEGGELAYYDAEMDQHWRLGELSLHTPEVFLDDRYSVAEVAMMINRGGALEGVLELNCDNLAFSFSGLLEGFNLADTYKYWTPYVNVQSVEGVAMADVKIQGTVDDILAMNIAGSVAADGLAIAGPDGGNIFSAKRLDAAVAELNIARERYIFDSLTAEGYATELHFREDGSTNFDMLFYGEPEVSVETTERAVGEDMYEVQERVTVTTSEEVAPLRNMTLRIARLSLEGGVVDYSDRTMHEPFDYTLRDIAIKCDNFDLAAVNRISLRAQLPKQGSALFMWEGSINDFYNQSLLAMLSNVDMQGLSTYLEHLTAFPIKSGNMTFRSQNVVTNGKLSGINQLGTYQFTLGDKNRDLEVEYPLPLKFGLFVLTDGNDHIDVDFPISGNIESPEFSYRKIIMRAIGNLLLKIVATPFEWMSPEKQDAFRHIDFDLLMAGLDSEHYARLDKMAETLREDGTLRVRLTQRVNYDRAVQRLSDLNLKIAYYNATEGRESGYLDMLDFVRINDMRLSRRDVAAFADSQLLSRGIDPTHMSAHAKAKSLYGDMVDSQLVELMRLRNRIIKEYIAFQHSDVDSLTFAINDVVLEDMIDYRGKDRYTVTLVIDDEEVEILDPAAEEVIDEEYYDAFILEDEELGEDAGVDGGAELNAQDDSSGTEVVEENDPKEQVITAAE